MPQQALVTPISSNRVHKKELSPYLWSIIVGRAQTG